MLEDGEICQCMFYSRRVAYKRAVAWINAQKMRSMYVRDGKAISQEKRGTKYLMYSEVSCVFLRLIYRMAACNSARSPGTFHLIVSVIPILINFWRTSKQQQHSSPVFVSQTRMSVLFNHALLMSHMKRSLNGCLGLWKKHVCVECKWAHLAHWAFIQSDYSTFTLKHALFLLTGLKPVLQRDHCTISVADNATVYIRTVWCTSLSGCWGLGIGRWRCYDEW